MEVWSTIFVQLNPEAKEQLLEGKLNHFTCARCGMEGPLGTRLLYHDGIGEFVVWFCPFDKMDAEFLDMFTETGEYRRHLSFGPEEDMPHYFRSAHVVFSMEELARYVTFRDRLKT